MKAKWSLLFYFTNILLCSPGTVGHEIYRTLCGTSPLYIKPSSLDIKLLTWLIKFAAKCRVLVIATGHGMLGLTLATGTGKIVTDLVYDKTPDINIRPFGINRF